MVEVDGRSLRPIPSTAQLDDITVQVAGVQVQMGPRIVYHVVWTLNNERKSEWVEAFELRSPPP